MYIVMKSWSKAHQETFCAYNICMYVYVYVYVFQISMILICLFSNYWIYS